MQEKQIPDLWRMLKIYNKRTPDSSQRTNETIKNSVTKAFFLPLYYLIYFSNEWSDYKYFTKWYEIIQDEMCYINMRYIFAWILQ